MSRVAVVTGAGKGAGRGIAKVLAKDGIKVIVVSRTKTDLESLIEEITADGGEGHLIVTDTSDKTSVQNMAKEVKEKFGCPDIVVNNAGLYVLQSFAESDSSTWDKMVDVNIKGYLYVIGEFLSDMKRRDSGHIVNITSDNEKFPAPGLAVYCGTKHFWQGCSQAIRLELKGSKVRLTNIQPGWIWTEGIEKMMEDKSQVEILDRFELANSAEFAKGKDLMLSPYDIGVAVLEAINKPANVQVHEVLLRDPFSVY